MRLIVLAAGQGFKLDGFNKALIQDPATGETVLARYLRLFAGWDVTVVVGYGAIRIMSAYPTLDYVYNAEWSLTGNSYSLGLALDERPSLVVSSDLFFDEPMVELIAASPPNAAVVVRSENKRVQSVRGRLEGAIVTETYLGEPRDPGDVETTGIYKVSDADLLREWKRRCARNRGAFAGLTLPLEGRNVHAVDTRELFLHEVNDPFDYLALIRRRKDGPRPE